ncbi:hypothetical protein JKF63_06253 [Porcisia hertigi]|uniref:Uncharacterized protein n=1 Tax=Porcisia hertigi TaxID=2761500 RepID=A0A836IZG3_9TRYP|nr:hypothetical protein JKF63_06253 [Porcisia hertigi]
MGRAADSNQCPGNAYRYVGPSSQLVGSRTAVTVAAASTAPELTTSIQSRPLQANPSHPLLWNNSTGSNTGTGSAQTSLSRQRHAGFTSGFAAGDSSGPVSSSASALSTPSSSFAFAFSSGDGRHQRQSTHDGCVGSSRLSSCSTAHVLRPRRRSQGRIPPSSPSSSAPVAGLAAAEVGNAGVPSAKVGKERTVMAVNYNALFHKELQRQESHGPVAEALMSSSSLSPSPGLPTGGVPLAQLLPSDRAVVHGTGAHNGFLPPGTATPPLCVTASLEFAGTVEGPLPPEVRRIIAQSCPEGSSAAERNAIIDVVEQQARRLISTGRRVKVYREELTAAEEERRDLSTTVEERHLVRSALQGEVDDINARIAALLQERGLVEAQLNAQNEAAARDEHKLTEAQNRVTLLRKTIDGIAEETMVARLMLQQQVPSLHIENYY